jgi:tetratricopeptide (TPR) repeat protein
LECARDALRQGHHEEALKYYKQVNDPGPEGLFGRAQCQFRLNEFDDALATCEMLDLATGSTSWESPLVRGWIAERRGQKIMAYSWYTQSFKRGYPDGEALAKRVK